MRCAPAKRTEIGDFGQAPARRRSPSTALRWRAHLSGPRAALRQRADLRSGAAVAGLAFDIDGGGLGHVELGGAVQEAAATASLHAPNPVSIYRAHSLSSVSHAR